MQRDLALVKPTRKYASQVMHYKQEMLANNDSLDGCAGLEDTDSFDEWIDFDNRLKKEIRRRLCAVGSIFSYSEGMTSSSASLISDVRYPLFCCNTEEILGIAFCHRNVKKGMPKRCSPYSCPSAKSRASNVFYLPVTRAMKHQDGRLSAMVERWRMKS